MTVAAHHDNRPHGSGCRFPVIVPIVFHARWWTGHAMGGGGVDGHREVGGGVLEARAGAAIAESLASSTDARICIVEAAPTPGLHSSGRSVAVFDPLYGDESVRALSAASRR